MKLPRMPGFWRKLPRFVKAGIILLLAAGPVAWWWLGSGGEEKKIQTVAVVKGDVEDLITAQGTLEAKEYVDVGTQVSGQLKHLYVELGDNVEKGQLLAEIDPTVYQSRVDATTAQLKTLKAQLAQQQAQLVLARLNHQRNVQLAESNAISRQEFDSSEATLKSAEASVAAIGGQIEQAESSLKENMADLGYTKIYAPMSGTVVAQTTREGQTVNASQQAPTIVQVADLDTMTVRAQVAEADIPSISPSMLVRFSTLGAMDQKWEGTVRQVLPSPEVINNVVLYNVLIDVDNRDRRLMTGMTAQVFFVKGEAHDVLTVPVSALGKRVRVGDKGGAQGYEVGVVQGKNVVSRTILVGLKNRTVAEVKGGINAGEIVLRQVGREVSGTSRGAGGGRGGPMPFL